MIFKTCGLPEAGSWFSVFELWQLCFIVLVDMRTLGSVFTHMLLCALVVPFLIKTANHSLCISALLLEASAFV
jgi:hypothetical protein